MLLAPKLAGGWYLLGEPSKWVSVSSQRFTGVVSDAASATVSMTGKAGEAVTVSIGGLPCVVQSATADGKEIACKTTTSANETVALGAAGNRKYTKTLHY